ncbi:MAG: hypothetical protein WAK34_16660 [Rhodoplanes sp.]
MQLAVIKHEIATRKAQGLPPLTEADAGWQIVLKNLARYQEACRKAGFDPDQPRVPAGNPGGGQWTSGGADGGSDTGGGINDPRILSDVTPDNWKTNRVSSTSKKGHSAEPFRGNDGLLRHRGACSSRLYYLRRSVRRKNCSDRCTVRKKISIRRQALASTRSDGQRRLLVD